jgi:hypothetical protein
MGTLHDKDAPAGFLLGFGTVKGFRKVFSATRLVFRSESAASGNGSAYYRAGH